jgi:hypothetical protein
MQTQPRERIFFTRFPDYVPPEITSIHHHALAAGRFLVVAWAWSLEEAEYRQQTLAVAASLEDAREFIPAGAVPVAVPETFGVECWERP